MNLFIRYNQEPDTELDETLIEVFESLGFEVKFEGYDISGGNRDLYFEKFDPWENMESKEVH